MTRSMVDSLRQARESRTPKPAPSGDGRHQMVETKPLSPAELVGKHTT